MIEPATSTAAETVHRPRRARVLRAGAVLLALGVFVTYSNVQLWLHGASAVDPRSVFYAATGIFLLVIAFAILVGSLRGLPRLTIAPTGVTLQTAFGTRWAAWESLAPFSLAMIYVGPFARSPRSATAPIIGAAASPSVRRAKKFTIPDSFLTPIDTLVGELNACRNSAVAIPTASVWTTEAKNELPLPDRGMKTPWVTFIILAVLVAVFAAEQRYAVVPTGRVWRPNISTLIALGALNHRAVLVDGEWYRLLTSAVLHLDTTHLVGNGIALVMAGYILERLVGRIWYLALFVVGAIGGSLMSLAINPAAITSVGASGAIMGLFAAAIVISFRLPVGSKARWWTQIGSMRVLIPSLLPLATSGDQIDYAGHFGGALAGTAASLILFKTWREQRASSPLRSVAAGIAAIGVVAFIAGGGEVARHYDRYRVIAALIPASEMPKGNPPAAEAERLFARYPLDPRAHMFRAAARAAANDIAGAEREMRTALALTQDLRFYFGPPAENVVRAALAVLLADAGKKSEGKQLADSVCHAPPAEQPPEKIRKTLADSHLCE